MEVVYHVKKVSTIFAENWSRNIILKTNCSISWKVIWKPIVQWIKHNFVPSNFGMGETNTVFSRPNLTFLSSLSELRFNFQQNRWFQQDLCNVAGFWSSISQFLTVAPWATCCTSAGLSTVPHWVPFKEPGFPRGPFCWHGSLLDLLFWPRPPFLCFRLNHTKRLS